MSTGQRSRQLFVVLSLAVASATLSSSAAHGDESGLTLEQAVRLSLAGPKILAARESVAQARAEVKAASLTPNPSLGIEAGMLPLTRRYTVDEPGGPPELSAGISYPIDWALFGKRSAAVVSSEVAVSVAEAEYTDIVRQQVSETTEAFYSVMEATALLETAKQAQGDLAQAEAAIEKAVASGGRPQVELSRVRLEWHGTRREERSAQSALVSATSTLRALLGESESVPSLKVVGTLDAPLTVKPLSVEAAFTVALENRPDILALRRRAAKAGRDQVVEGRNAWPETSLGIGVTHQFQQSIGDPDVTAWGVSIEMGLPVFNRNQGNRAKAASATVQAAHELTAAETALFAEVTQAVASLSTAFENAAEMTQTDLALASQVRDSLRTAYEAGGRPLIEMLDAQRAYRETYRAYVTCRADYWRALSQYEAALGKKVTP